MKKSFGHFSPDGREYVITDAAIPPRSQINFLWNDNLITGMNQFGSGEGIFNDRTMLYNDLRGRVDAINDGRRYFYVRDNGSGKFWNTGWFPTKVKGAKYQATVGLGYSKYEITYSDIIINSKVFLAPDEPVEIWEFSIRNNSRKKRNLSLIPYVEWKLLGYPIFGSIYSYLRSTYDKGCNAVLSYNLSDECPHERYNAFVATDGKVKSWCGSRRQFLGPYGHIGAPDAVISEKMACKEPWCEDLAGSMSIEASLSGGQEKKITVLMGLFGSVAEKSRIIRKVISSGYRKKSFEKLMRSKDEMIKKVMIKTPNERMNVMTNIWSKQQTQLCAEFGRDGARGFRDTLQDAWGMAVFNPKLARAKIIETLQHQCADGHGIRGWMPLQLHHYSDGPVWIVLTVIAYLKETGDYGILKEKVKFLDKGTASVYDRVVLSLRHLSNDTGKHGLVKAHCGDWNDSLNWMGKDGIGESVWTSIGLFYAMNVFIDFLKKKKSDDKNLLSEMIKRREKIEKAIQKYGWDGNWYLAGYSDFGNPVGSHKNKEGKIFLNSQTWAILSDLAKGDRYKKCLKAIDNILESEHGSLTLKPSFTKKDKNVGRVSMLLPGMYENGTPYCHGTSFKIVADLHAKRADKALVSFLKVMPDSSKHPSSVSGSEPYAFTNQYLGPDNARAGESISGWITGTAGWMFRAVVEYFLGIKPDFDGFHIDPCLPSGWKNASIQRLIRGRKYNIEITRKGKDYSVKVNGKDVPSKYVEY
ncbi:MAG TPA: hypothetical protein DCZ94_20815 [Lentisphaeria bacterium]|nr:MAG: hypothetical protein A2X48_09040 [Lentisphaerae bacterium GWF2_49_21]HBC89390.1 hypothetical protein [Lentisphaeria bacterium]